MSSDATETIVVLGASYVGLTVAHKLLKTTYPTSKNFKVVLVNPSTHFYWNCASVRAIVPGQFKDDQLYSRIDQGFEKYPQGSFQFILGTATACDPAAKSVTIKTAEGETVQPYSTLVIATGSRTLDDSIPWKQSSLGYQDTKDKLEQIREQVTAAKSIVVVGGGPTGIETVAELGFEYGKTKEITLVSSHELYNGTVPKSVVKFTEAELKKLNVKIITNAKVENPQTASDGKTTLTLSNGTSLETDLYLPTMGVIPNTSFLPASILDAKGHVVVNQYLQVVGHEKTIWCAGDAANAQNAQLIYAMASSQALAKNLDATIKGKPPVEYKKGGSEMMGVTLGRSRATGRYGGMKLPSLIIWFAKGRTLGTQDIHKYTSGAQF